MRCLFEKKYCGSTPILFFDLIEKSFRHFEHQFQGTLYLHFYLRNH